MGRGIERRGVVVLLTGILVACSDIARFSVAVPELPADVEWAALLTEGGAGSGFVHREAGRFDLPLLDGDPSGRAWILAYSGDRLAAMTSLDEVELRRAHVRIASPNDPLLDAPSWVGAGEWRDDELLLEAASTPLPEITVSWLPPCPRLLGDEGGYLATTCITHSCAGQAVQVACRLSFTFEACGIDRIEGVVGPRGQFELQPSTELGVCTPSPTPLSASATASAVCQAGTRGLRCDNHLVVPRAPVLRGTHRKVKSVPIAPLVPNVERQGYLSGLALVGRPGERKLAVSAYHGGLDGLRCEVSPTDLLLIDPETLATTSTVSSFTCMANLASDPTGMGFYATEGARGQRIVHLDERAAVIAEARLAGAVPNLSFARALRVSAATGRVAVLYGQASATSLGELRLFDLNLEPVGSLTELSDRLVDVALLDNGKIVVFDDRGGFVRYSRDLRAELTSSLREACGYSTDVYYLAADPTGDKLMMSARYAEQGQVVFVVSTSDLSCRQATFYEWSAFPAGMLAWPADPRFVLVGVDNADTTFTPRDRFRSSVALLEIDTGVFVPGAVAIGSTPVIPLASDGRRVFAILPHEAGIARIDPIPSY